MRSPPAAAAATRNQQPRPGVVQAIAEALVPAVPDLAEAARNAGDDALEYFYTASGSGIEVGQIVLQRAKQQLPPSAHSQLLTLLTLLSTRLGTLLLAGYLALTLKFPFIAKFEDLPVNRRERILRAWSCSWLMVLRKAFRGLKALIMAALLTQLDEKGSNPFLRAVGYEAGLDAKKRLPKPSAKALESESLLAEAVVDLQEAARSGSMVDLLRSRGLAARHVDHRDEGLLGGAANTAGVVECDVVVVGSGAGGAVAAAVLAAAGMRVVVLEKSAHKPTASLTLQEGESHSTMYETGGFSTTEDCAVTIVAGSVLGGGTKINWTAAIRPTPQVVNEWAQLLGDETFPARYEASMDAVCACIGVVPHRPPHNAHNARMKSGLAAAGFGPEDYDHNCSQESCSAYCTLGCASGRKQAADSTFLTDCVQHGGKILTCAYAEQLLWEPTDAPPDSEAAPRGAVRGVLARCAYANSIPAYRGRDTKDAPQLMIRSRIVVCAAGTLHTPALMLRSGITVGGNIGANFRIHPSSVVVGYFPRSTATGEAAKAGKQGSVRLWEGGLMGVISRLAVGAAGHGTHLSIAISHPGMLAAMMPWTSGREYKQQLSRLGDAVLALSFARDMDSGRISIGPGGCPMYHYWPSRRDRFVMLKGMEACVRSLVAAGADQVTTLHNAGLTLDCKQNGSKEELEAFVKKIWMHGIQRHSIPVLTAHQMSSARMGAHPSTSACDPTGCCWEVAGLYVADGSALPTCSGVNPMLAIQAMAHATAQAILRAAGADHNKRGVAAVDDTLKGMGNARAGGEAADQIPGRVKRE